MASQLEIDAKAITRAVCIAPGSGNGRAVLIMLSGLPGSGKTYFGNILRKRINAIIIESDFARKVLFPKALYSAEENRRLFNAIHLLTENLLSLGKTVILDATNLKERDRTPLYDIAGRQKADLIIIELKAPYNVIKRRLLERIGRIGLSSEADIEVYNRMKKAQEKIKRQHIVINTSGDIEPFIAKIEDRLRGFKPL